MSEYILTPPHLIELPRTEQQSLWTCCQQLEEPWDYSLGSQSSVGWRFSTLQLKLDGTSLRTRKHNKIYTLFEQPMPVLLLRI